MEKALEILFRYWGYHSFRSSQEKIVEALIKNEDVIALLPTGGGKSICFQVPAMLKEGICIVVSPLIALIKDQVNALNEKGIKATDLSGNISFSEMERRMDNCFYQYYKFLYISPERLENQWVQKRIEQLNVSMIAIDEAHCISHWGKDFRPSYLKCGILREKFPSAILVALTATATQRVIDDIKDALHLSSATLIKGNLYRSNLIYNVLKVDDKWYELHKYLERKQGSAIIYLRNRKGVEQMADYLEKRGVSATFFHGGLSSEQKNYRLGMWVYNDVRVMVATNAFGMGIDKPDVRLVIHWDIPSSIEDYFQEVGRAGRDGHQSEGILLYNDNDILNFDRNFRNSITDISFLKKIYHQLNQYFWIADSEGEGQVFPLSLTDFCQKNKLNTLQTYSALQKLERLGICTVSERYKNQSLVQILLNPKDIVQMVDQSFSENQRKTILYLIRHNPLIYTTLVGINEDELSDELSLSSIVLKDVLLRLAEREIIKYFPKSTDIEIVFNQPRSDERLINSVAPQVKVVRAIKKEKYEAMRKFIINDKECLSVQLMNYFEDYTARPCQKCSVCVNKNKSNTMGLLQLSEQVKRYLKHTCCDVNEIMNQFSLSKDEANVVLDYLIDEQIIKKHTDNRYQLKIR